MSDSDDLLAALAQVAAALLRLGVRHFVCELPADQIDLFLAAFGDDSYVSGPAVRQAVERRSCVHLVYLPTAYKVVVFVSRGRPFDQEAITRAVPQSLAADNPLRVPVSKGPRLYVACRVSPRLGCWSSEKGSCVTRRWLAEPSENYSSSVSGMGTNPIRCFREAGRHSGLTAGRSSRRRS